MKRILLVLSLGVAAAGLGACADDYYGGGYGHGYGYNDGPGFYAYHPIGYDGFYDDAYGPFYDGYWGDGGFYYSTGEGRPYVLDRDNHFRHESGEGFHAFHGGMHMGDHGDHRHH